MGGELDVQHGRFARRFSRSESRESALAYMRGLIAPLQRKNGWTLAEEASHAGSDRLHRLLNQIEWDADLVLDDIRSYVVEHLGNRDAVLIIDDTGFLKKGDRSASVRRQYSDTAGRTENCQVGVFLAYATEPGRTLIDRRLYLPASWTDDRERCRSVGIEDTVGFATKIAIARQVLRKAIADQLPFRWVRADAGYGYSKSWRTELEQADVFHVMATTRHDTVVPRLVLDHPVRDLFTDLPRQKWKRRSCGKGPHRPPNLRLGPRRGPCLAPPGPAALGPRPPQYQQARRDLLLHRLLPHRDHAGRAHPGRGQPLGDRGSFQTAKQCGLDDYQVRRYPGWHPATSLWPWPSTPA